MQPLKERLTVVMKNLKAYLIQFSGLKIGKHQFEYQLDNSFFEHFNFEEFNSVAIKVDLILEKKNTPPKKNPPFGRSP